jgi:hypothetical protein
MVISVPLTAGEADAIVGVRTWGRAATMTGRYDKFNVVAESRKLLKGAKTKVDRGSLLQALAHDYVAAHRKPGKA